MKKVFKRNISIGFSSPRCRHRHNHLYEVLLGLKPGMKFQIITRRNVIILRKIENPEDEYEDILIDDLLVGDEHDTLEEWTHLQESAIDSWDEKQELIKWKNTQKEK